MKKHEASFGILLRHWFRANGISMLTCHIEIKDTRKENSFYFRELAQEQIDVALACSSDKGCLIRNASGTTGSGDYLFMRNAPAWIIIKYPLGFVFIGIETFVMEKERSKRKSLTWERAQEISVKIVISKS